MDDETVTDKELSHLIDEWLADARPERYDEDDRDWMEPVIAKALDALREQSVEQQLEDAARRKVRSREGQAVKRTHKELRDIAELGRLPLGWGVGDDWKIANHELLHLPLKIGGVRVLLGAASAADLEQWCNENQREQDDDNVRRGEARKGAQLIVGWLRSQQQRRFDDLAAPTELPAGRLTPSTGGAADQGAQTNDRARPGTA